MKKIFQKSNKILGLERMNEMGFNVPPFDFICDFTDLGMQYEDLNIYYPPEILKKIIKKKIKKFDLKNGLSIRSASFDEDNSNQSAAGRYISFNGLTDEKEIIAGAIQIWFHHRNNSKNTKCPLIIQETHPSFYSGVAFKDNDLVIIESYFGACSNIVEGRVMPYITIIKNGEITHQYNSDRKTCDVFYIHKNIFKEEITNSGMFLTPKISNFTTNTRFYNYENNMIIKAYGYRPQMPIKTYEDKILPSIISCLNLLDNPKGVDIEWGSDINGNLYMYQFRNMTRKINFAQTQTNNVSDSNGLITGIASSQGKAKGITVSSKDIKKGQNNILLLEFDNVEDVSILNNVKGVIALRGGVLSHLSIICRELNIPCIVGINKPISLGQSVEIDGDIGCIKIV